MTGIMRIGTLSLALAAALWLTPAAAAESVTEPGAARPAAAPSANLDAPAAKAPAAPAAEGNLTVNLAAGAVFRQTGGKEQQVAGDAGGLEFSWETSVSPYAEIFFKEQPRLPEFSSATVRARFRTEAGCPVNGVGLRLCDAGNETFQYHAVFRPADGEVEIVWDVKAGNPPQGSWGVRVDHRLDMPVKIQGFAIGYANNVPQGRLRLLSMTVEIASGATVPAERTRYTFDREDSFRRIWGVGELRPAEDGLHVSGIRDWVGVSEMKNSMQDGRFRPLEFTVEGRAVTGAVKVGVEFRDITNKKFAAPEVPLTDGRAVLDLRDLMAEASLPVTMQCITLRNADKAKGPAEAVLRRARLTVAQTPTEAVDFAVETGMTARVLRPGAEKDLKLVFTNAAREAGRFTATVEFSGYNGDRQTLVLPLELKAGERREITPDWKPVSRGHWQVAATVRGNGSGNRTVRTFAYMDPAGPTPGRAPGFLFSVCTHTGRWCLADQEREIAAAALCGVKVARAGSDWGRIQPREDVWDWELFDRMVNEYGAKGIELQAMLGFTPQWAAPAEVRNSKDWLDWNRAAPRMDAWRRYAHAVAERYRGKIRFWEVWNEPDLKGFNHMTLDEYVDRQKAAYEEIKKADPDAMVMTGGFATMSAHPGKKSPTFHRDYLVKAAGGFDIHAHHEHGPFIKYVQMIEEYLQPMRRETGTAVPWYANETAIHSLGGAEREQAETLFKKLLYSWSQGSIGFTWYDLRNDGYDAGNAEHNFGMVTNDFYPKPVYCAYNTLAGNYMKMRFVRRLDAPAPLWAFLFTDGKDALIPLWEEGGATAAARLVHSTAARAEIIDMMGNVTPIPAVEGLVLLPPAREPRSLRLRGVSDATLGGVLVEAGADATAAVGRPLRMGLKLHNPLKEEKTFVLRALALPRGISVAPDRRELKITVPGGGDARAEFAMTVGADFRPQYGESLSALVSYEVTGTPWQGRLNVPVNAALVIPRDHKGKADFTLNQRRQVSGLAENDPATLHRIWSGPKDLSAEIRLAYADGRLRITVNAVDDRHSQPDHGTGAWKGDGIQMAMEIPGQKGYWEIGFSRHDDGGSDVNLYSVPMGVKWTPAAPNVTLVTAREGDRTDYEIVLDAAALGITDAIAHSGFRFNLLLNDNDGEGRDGWICIAPGIGDSKNPKKYPFVVFE